jgi:hypothetical protein
MSKRSDEQKEKRSMRETGKRLLAAAHEMSAIARREAEPAHVHAPSSHALAHALYDAAPSSRSLRFSRPPKPGGSTAPRSRANRART